jgi:isopenicillin-N epimerase
VQKAECRTKQDSQRALDDGVLEIGIAAYLLTRRTSVSDWPKATAGLWLSGDFIAYWVAADLACVTVCPWDAELKAAAETLSTLRLLSCGGMPRLKQLSTTSECLRDKSGARMPQKLPAILRLSNVRKPAARRSLWWLDPSVSFLNHGSFGACPKPVLEYQETLHRQLEREPVSFMVRELEPLLDNARAALARFIGAKSRNLAFVANATSGVNAVLRSLTFRRGDEILVTDHEYNACRNVVDYVAEQAGAKVIVAPIPFPVADENQIIEPIFSRVTPRTRLALLDHVTSQTALVLPLERIVPELENRNVPVLVDGAHAPGMIPLELEKLGASYYTGNCHKWICAPKGAALLHIREDRQKGIRPTIISHGANSPRTDRTRFLIEFGWTGTWDPTAMLSVPFALEFIGSLLPGGWPEVMRRNRELALAGRRLLADALESPLPCPDSMIGSLASLRIPDAQSIKPPKSPLYLDEIQERLFAKYKIEVPVIPWPAPPKRLLRISAQLYNSMPEYERLAAALKEEAL